MDTRAIAKEYRSMHWTKIMREHKESGQSIKEFCASIGIAQNVFYYWQRKLREAACQELLPVLQEKAKKEIIPNGWAVCSVADNPSTGGAVSIEIGKSKVTAGVDVNLELLKNVCRALMSIC